MSKSKGKRFCNKGLPSPRQLYRGLRRGCRGRFSRGWRSNVAFTNVAKLSMKASDPKMAEMLAIWPDYPPPACPGYAWDYSYGACVSYVYDHGSAQTTLSAITRSTADKVSVMLLVHFQHFSLGQPMCGEGEQDRPAIPGTRTFTYEALRLAVGYICAEV